MTNLRVEVQPEEVGFDAGRLARIDRHFARYVDDGRLPGWLVLVSRDGRIAHLSTTWRPCTFPSPARAARSATTRSGRSRSGRPRRCSAGTA